LDELKISDLVVFLLTLGSLTWYLKKCVSRGDFKDFPNWVLPSLLAYHFTISAIAVYFVCIYGGDSMGYWSLNADTSQNAQTWMDYWGYNTFFIQWLNYIPYKILELHFFTGCVIYSSLSALGFFWLLRLCKAYYVQAKERSNFLSICLILLFFFPSQHFWTGIVGKEAVLWFVLILTLKSLKEKKLVYLILSIAILMWIRPVLGVLVLGVGLTVWMVSSTVSVRMKIGALIFAGISAVLGFFFLTYIMHLDQISLQSLKEYSEGQYAFLATFEPNTLISMQEYSVFGKLIVVGFRPFGVEIFSFWGVFSGIENFLFLILALGTIPALVYSVGNRRKFFIILAVMSGIILYLFSISISVNVLGIMIRLKSSVTPFLSILGWYGWFLFFRQKLRIKEQLCI